jgi:Domain of unknown function (DUF4279)
MSDLKRWAKKTMANEGYVSVSIRGNFIPEEFSALVGLVPSKTWRKGERDVERVIPKVSGWCLSSRKVTGDFIDFFDLADELLLPLSEKAGILRDATHTHDAQITVHMVIYISVLDSVPTPAIGLSAPAISILERLGATLDIDTYRNDIPEEKTEPNKALEPTIMAVTECAPSSTLRASHERGSV